MNIQELNSTQKKQLSEVAFSKDSFFKYYPCQVELINGQKIENVYIVEEQSYKRLWGVMPDQDSAKKYVLIENIYNIKESPNRLAPNLANKLYQAGESGMGYCLFKIVFDNGQTMDVGTGNAVDFIPLPNGLNAKNVKDVLPHQGSRKDYVKGPDYYWCLYKK